MKSSDSSTTRFVLIVSIVALIAAGGNAKADFAFGQPNNLGTPVNTVYDECAPYVSADGLSLYFSEYLNNAPSGHGGSDIWLSTRESADDPWGTPENLGPPINTSSEDSMPYLSADGLALYFGSDRPDGSGGWDLWVAKRATTDANWATATVENLGPNINSAYDDGLPTISPDGLYLYFSDWLNPRPGPDGLGNGDIWVSTRETVSDPWQPAENLGAPVNSSSYELSPSISSDGRVLFFQSRRAGAPAADIWMTTRATTEDDWEPPVRLEDPVNTLASDPTPYISPDGSTLYFCSKRSGGYGGYDLYQASITSAVDFNGDGKTNARDVVILMQHWGGNESLCDIGPMPWGDGIVDAKDLIVLAEHLTDDGALLVGDVNCDGSVDLLDLTQLAQNWCTQEP